MPKERQHLLLATEVARFLERTGRGEIIPAGHHVSFLLGAISPDCHFYDAPTFALAAAGGVIHGDNAGVGLEAVRTLLITGCAEHPPLSDAGRAYALGVASHFLADRQLHPHIEELAHMRLAPGTAWENALGDLSSKDRHIWIESELDACWTPTIGPPDGFLPLLARFQREHAFRKAHLARLREILRRAGVSPPPSVSRLNRAMSIQIAMLRGFCGGRFTFLKARLLRSGGFGAYMGSLIVPRTPRLPDLLADLREKDPSLPDLAGGTLLAETVVMIANGLGEL